MIGLFAEAPALPLHTAGPYVAAAYIVFVLVIVIYVGIMATRLIRNQRELAEIRRQLEQRELEQREQQGSAQDRESESHKEHVA